ncbi:MAG: TatD family hydrolase [Candidatus Jordarchaeaceae archaeon]
MFVDVHCHIDLYPDLEDVVMRAKQVSVAAIVAVSMDVKSMEKIIEISKRYSRFVFPSLGLHPETSSENDEIELGKAVELIRNNSGNLVAIGEIGLDHYFVKDKGAYPRQEKIFREMLSLAEKLNLPVILHTKGAERLIFETIEEYKLRKVLIHWYTGPKDLIDIGIKRGYYFSITPAIAYSKKVQYIAEKVEIDYLLSESDGPVEYRRVRGEPKDCPIIVQKIANIKRYKENDVEQKLFENAVSFFNLKLETEQSSKK